MTSSSLKIDRLKYALAHQKAKFKKIGFYKYISIINFILLFTLVPALLELVWPSQQQHLSTYWLYQIVIVGLNIISIFLYSVAMYFIYTRKIPFFEQFRCAPNRKWMWEENPQKWKPFFFKTLTMVFFNIFVTGPVVAWITYPKDFKIQMNIQDRPAFITMVWQFMIFMLVEQIVFYAVHRLLHTPLFYWIHKQHHEYNTTISLALVYANPLEHIVANLVSTGLGITLLSKVYPVHMFTVIVWFIFRVIQSSDGHCGYDWPWALSHCLPFSAGGDYHYFHHSNNSGNYGAILHIFDTLANTNIEYIEKENVGSKGIEKMKQND